MLCLNGHSISLDRKEDGATMDFISHAHSDHIAAARRSNGIVASEETLSLLKAVHGISPKACAEVPGWVRLLDAGHMLGSKQISVRDSESGMRVTYTGDFQMQKSRVCAPTQVEKADVLIMDSTYCDPAIRFDDRAETERAIQLWTESRLKSGIVLFGTYSMGKAQELAAILNEVNIVPAVTERIALANGVYARHGVGLDCVVSKFDGSDADPIMRGNFVGIVANNKLSEMREAVTRSYGRRAYTSVATGFAKSFSFNTDSQFGLSDHADFWQAMDYIGKAQPEEVLTFGGNSRMFAYELRKEGVNAHVFGEAGPGASKAAAGIRITAGDEAVTVGVGGV